MALSIIKLVIFSLLFTSAALAGATANSHTFSRSLLPEELGLKKEKLSHLHFYFHDIARGRKATAVRVAEAKMTRKAATGFGRVVMIDDLLTQGPELSSKIIGRAQGIYAYASLNDVSLLMVHNYVFTEGKYNGSTLSVLGRNAVISDVREMPIVGGSGALPVRTWLRSGEDARPPDRSCGCGVQRFRIPLLIMFRSCPRRRAILAK